MRRRADEIVKQNSARGGDAIEAESLAERQARLRRQRDMILAKKRAEREKEMQDYLNQGGVDLAMKRDSNENAEAVERRRQIAQKLRQELAN